jgi:galactokinase
LTDFRDLFCRAPEVVALAPGRVNLLGEHTDYNGGFVLPTAVPQRTHVEMARGAGATVRAATSASDPRYEVVEYQVGQEMPRQTWLDYVQGVTAALNLLGVPLGGFYVRIESAVPVGSGLASSAALTVSLLRGLRTLFELPLDDLTVARVAQQVENDFVGARVGIMDPMAVSLALEGSALFLDTRSLRYERLPLPRGIELVVIDSGVKHSNALGEYNTRRLECQRAAELLNVTQLRDLDVSEAIRAAGLPEPLGRRVRHVVTENARVQVAVAALLAADLERLGQLFCESHASMRDDYEVSVPQVDSLVELASAEPAVYGARLTGGGFGGSVVILARAGMGRATARGIASAYAERVKRTPTILMPVF